MIIFGSLVTVTAHDTAKNRIAHDKQTKYRIFIANAAALSSTAVQSQQAAYTLYSIHRPLRIAACKLQEEQVSLLAIMSYDNVFLGALHM